MEVSAEVQINRPRAVVWNAIIDIDNCAGMISGILNIEVLERPPTGVVGLKWRETRRMFGKESSEVMWITDAEDNGYYRTRAESHGAVYVSEMSLGNDAAGTCLRMSFSGRPQTLVSKILSMATGFMVRGSMVKVIERDLLDIKTFVENAGKR